MDRVFHALAGYLAWCFFEMMTKKKLSEKQNRVFTYFRVRNIFFNEIPMETFRRRGFIGRPRKTLQEGMHDAPARLTLGQISSRPHTTDFPPNGGEN